MLSLPETTSWYIWVNFNWLKKHGMLSREKQIWYFIQKKNIRCGIKQDNALSRVILILQYKKSPTKQYYIIMAVLRAVPIAYKSPPWDDSSHFEYFSAI